MPLSKLTNGIKTQRMLLRPIEWADIDLFVDLDSDPEVVRYVHAGQPIPRQAYEDWLMSRMRS